MDIKSIFRKLIPIQIRRTIFHIKTISDLKKEISELRLEILYFKVIHYYEFNPTFKFESEINYLKKIGKITPFPYKQIKSTPEINGGIDEMKEMPYVIHNQKKLFFPGNWSFEDARSMYTNYITTENILGGEYSEKTPHQYLTRNFNIEKDDTVIDIGAAEGLFLLDVIDRVKKGYLFEPNSEWILPLKATFESYMDKIEIIEKFANDNDTTTNAKLDSILKIDTEGVFIKIDVEGCEHQVLKGAENLLNQKKNIRISCCTYHKAHDAEELNLFFRKNGFDTEFSDGYMLFPYDEEIRPPYFRKGIIRARKTK